jgi:hypothetical protein
MASHSLSNALIMRHRRSVHESCLADCSRSRKNQDNMRYNADGLGKTFAEAPVTASAASMRESIRATASRCTPVDVGTPLACSLRNGALLAAGTVLLIQGVIRAFPTTSPHVTHPLRMNGYLLQVCLLPGAWVHKSYQSTDLCRLFSSRSHTPSLLPIVSRLASV